MSQRIDKGPKIAPSMAGAARRRPGGMPQTPATTTMQPRPSSMAMSPPPPPPRSMRTPSASPRPTGSSMGPIRSYAHAAPQSPSLSAAGGSGGQRPPTPSSSAFKPSISSFAGIKKPTAFSPGASMANARKASAAIRAPTRESSRAPSVQPAGSPSAPVVPASPGPSSATTGPPPLSANSPPLQALSPPSIASGTPNPPSLASRPSIAKPGSSSKAIGPPSLGFRAKPAAIIGPPQRRLIAPSIAPRENEAPVAGPSGTSSSSKPMAAVAPPSDRPASNSAASPPATSSAQSLLPSRYDENGIAFTRQSQPRVPIAGPSSRPATASARKSAPSAASGSASPERAISPASGSHRSPTQRKTKKRKSPPQSLPPGHPTKPLSAYFLWLRENRPALCTANPEATAAEISKLGGAAWRALSEADREQFKDAAKQNKERYDADVATWQSQNGNELAILAQAAAVQSLETDAEEDGDPSVSRAKRPRKKRLGPKRAPSAYLLFSKDYRERLAAEAAADEEHAEAIVSTASRFGEISKKVSDAWRILPLEEKRPYLRRAEELKDEYEVVLQKWKEDHPEQAAIMEAEAEEKARQRRSSSTSRVPKDVRTISDDEREYEAMVAEHGDQLEATRLDPQAALMGDLAVSELKAGRASERTFELERVRKKARLEQEAVRKAEKEQLKERKALIKRNLKKQRRGERVELPKHVPEPDVRHLHLQRRLGDSDYATPASTTTQERSTSPKKGSQGPDEDEEDVEEELGGGPHDGQRRADHAAIPSLDGDDDDDNDDAASDAGSAASMNAMLSLRENKHAPQMRSVDGQMVIDESSLAYDRNENQVFEEDEIIEEETSHRFINSATRSKRAKPAKWSDSETDDFYKAVGMWGSDFEMISRMFPNRTRKQIKTKWTREERADPRRLDMAFARRVPVDLEVYSIMTNIDFSGPSPQVKGEEELATIKKAEEDDEDIKRRSISKTSQTPDPLSGRRRRGSSASRAGGATSDGESESHLGRSDRAMSTYSNRSGTSTAASNRASRQRSRQQAEKEDRQEREKSRRRESVQTGRDRVRGRDSRTPGGGQNDVVDEDWANLPDEEEIPYDYNA